MVNYSVSASEFLRATPKVNSVYPKFSQFRDIITFIFMISMMIMRIKWRMNDRWRMDG